MNAKQAARAAKKMEERAKKQEETISVTERITDREKLPGDFESKYQSEELKGKIADLGMWCLIPAVKENMNSPYGEKRLQENDLLFSFIDRFFPNEKYAFEPNMRDGRFVFLPENVSHQGIGICVSSQLPGFLEIGQFWYPEEFTSKGILSGQVYVDMYSQKPGEELAKMIRQLYFSKEDIKSLPYCTFPFAPDLIVRLDGYFMDRLNQSTTLIRDTLRNADERVQRNGEGLIMYMQRMMKNAK